MSRQHAPGSPPTSEAGMAAVNGAPARLAGLAGALPARRRRSLVTVVVQDAADNTVLMLAYADREALARTLETGEACYYSRRRGRLWRKGATSGHTQRLAAASLDCDGDAVLLRVWQAGPACHTGERSCFHRPLDRAGLARVRYEDPGCLEFLLRLERLIQERDQARPPGSYVSALFDAGPLRVLQKFGEEAVEFVLAAAASGPPVTSAADPGVPAVAAAATAGAPAHAAGSTPAAADVLEEAADVLFHLLVAFRSAGLTLSGVTGALRARRGGGPAATDPLPETSPPPRT